MDLRKLKKLIDLVEESGIAELEITEGEERVRITRNLHPTQHTVLLPQQAPQPVLAPPAASEAPVAAKASEPEGHLVVMEAPVDRVALHVRQRVVHPAHVPFVVKAQPAGIGRA